MAICWQAYISPPTGEPGIPHHPYGPPLPRNPNFGLFGLLSIGPRLVLQRGQQQQPRSTATLGYNASNPEKPHHEPGIHRHLFLCFQEPHHPPLREGHGGGGGEQQRAHARGHRRSAVADPSVRPPGVRSASCGGAAETSHFDGRRIQVSVV